MQFNSSSVNPLWLNPVGPQPLKPIDEHVASMNKSIGYSLQRNCCPKAAHAGRVERIDNCENAAGSAAKPSSTGLRSRVQPQLGPTDSATCVNELRYGSAVNRNQSKSA